MYLLQMTRKCQHSPLILSSLMFVLVAADRLLPTSASLVINSSTQPLVPAGNEQLRQQQPEGTPAAAADEAVAAPSSEAFIAQQSSLSPSVEQPPPFSPLSAPATVAVDLQQQHPHPKRNYASKDCGAKVLYSNAEAENRGAILNDPERDDYMRNPCERAQNKFLIIELCETIQPTALEIANFELFSSSPRQFRLWGSERYPTQEWALIGEFEALDNREVQLFTVLEHTSYAKFVKLELLTHYGMEHYCTLSTFCLYGTSMVDEYEAETVVVVDALQQQQQQQQLDSVFGRTFAATLPSTNSAVPAENNDGLLVVGEEDNNKWDSNSTTTTMGTKTAIIQRPSKQPANVAQRCQQCDESFLPECAWFCYAFFGPRQIHNQRTTGQTNSMRVMMDISSPPLAASKTSNSSLDFLNQISPSRSAICLRNDAEKRDQPQMPQVVQQQTSHVVQQQTSHVVQQQTVQQPQGPMLDVKVVEKGNLSPLPGTSSTHKESVFMKLNKRLTLLEQNMSLSSEHLLELSRRCVNGATRAESELKQQREGIAKEAERMAKQEANRVETEMKQKITELQHEVRRLSQQLQSVQTTVVQATGTGGFFYRPMLSPVHGYSASDSHCRGQQAWLVSDAMMGTTLPPLHSTSAAPYGASSMPDSKIHSPFDGKTMDGLWTTSQVVYLMLLVQLGTLVMLKSFRVLWAHVLHQCCPTNAQTLTPTSLTVNTSRHSLPLLNNSSTIC